MNSFTANISMLDLEVLVNSLTSELDLGRGKLNFTNDLVYTANRICLMNRKTLTVTKYAIFLLN